MFFPAIDILRAYAALSVLVLHTIAIFEWTTFPQSGPLSWLHIGGIGVDLFFVISGFVISLSAFSRLDKSSEQFRFDFAIQRFARIAPLYYLTCVIFVVFIYPHYIFDSSMPADGLLHLFFAHNLSKQYAGAINGVNWSVGAEMQFYVLMLIFAPILRKAHPLWIAIAMVGVAWAWRYYIMQHSDIAGQQGVYPRFWAITQLPGMLDEFAVGILLARFVRSNFGRRTVEFCEKRPWVIAIGTLVLASPSIEFIRWFLAESWTSTPMSVFGRSLLALTWGWLIFAFCCIRGPMALRLTAPLRYLGTISYGIYLWHLIVISTLHLRLTWLDGQRAFPYVLVLTCAFAAWSWHFFERPIMERAKNWLRGRTPGAGIKTTAALSAPAGIASHVAPSDVLAPCALETLENA